MIRLSHAVSRVGLAALGMCLTATIAHAQPRPPEPGATSAEAVLGERYENDGLERFLLGAGYRDLWSLPIPVAVLDLDTIAGGLTPTGRGGYGQTATLELVGADGRTYAVRPVDKDLTRRLDSLFVGTVVAEIVQDQVGQFLPTGGLIVDPLLEAVGILHPGHRLVIVPDHPRLGAYREDFAGAVGMFVERPAEGSGGTPGFAGSTRIAGTEEFLGILDAGECAVPDAREYLKARLVDMLVGDRDRHEGQWRWARFSTADGCHVWRPIPEDRDEAFVRNDGFARSLMRLVRPQQVKFGPDYPSVAGLTYNGWPLDRRLLAELDRAAWLEAADDVAAALTDEVIDLAVSRLPRAHVEARGTFLSTALKARRDALSEAALEFYELLSRQVEITASDRPDRAVVEHRPDGAVRIAITRRTASGGRASSFDRTFDPDDTREVRLYLGGGDDSVEVAGARGRILVRAVGGPGDDAFANLSHAPARLTRFYDAEGTNRFEGPAAVDRRPYERRASSNLVHRYALDWGAFTRYIPLVGYDPDLGVTGGLSVGIQRYGFRKDPWASDNVLRGTIASSGPEVAVGWSGQFRRVAFGADVTVDAEYSSLEILRYYGPGNATTVQSDTRFYEVERSEIRVSPGLEWGWGASERGATELDLRQLRPTLTLNVGPILEYARTPTGANADRFIGDLDPAPVGVGSFAQLGGRVDIELDTRDRSGYTRNGVRVVAGGSGFPAVLDVEEEFAELHGAASAYLTPGGSRHVPTLALRVAGREVFGDYPYHEAAYLGGARDVRGLRRGRFAGDAMVYGNVELRLPVLRGHLLFPAELGVHGAADVGRVFYDEDPAGSGRWHSAFGGGVWISLLDRTQALSITLMNGDDLTGLYVQAGLHF